MDADTMDGDVSVRGIEVFVIDMVWVIAIDRVGVIRAELLRIEMLWASSDFLIRGEEDGDWVMFDFLMLNKISKDGHDDGHAGFVIAA